MKKWVAILALLAAFVWQGGQMPRARAADPPILVFAAASLTDTLDAVGDAYAVTGKPRPTFSYAASSALAHQIENGAPAAIFVSADEDWMDYLARKDLIVPPSRVSLLANTLVLVAPASHPLAIAIAPNFALAQALGTGKLALGDPDAVPAGKYAKAALEKLGVWDSLQGNIVRAESVRGALAFVERGEAAAGIVYGTDAMLTPKVVVAGMFPPDSHPPISYPLAVVKGHDGAEAQGFRAFMLSDAAKAIYRKFGFVVK
jgi:molybdate transport system substrate-binding protein